MAISVELESIEPISQETGADQFRNRRIIPQLKNRQVGRAYPDDAPSQIDEHHLTPTSLPHLPMAEREITRPANGFDEVTALDWRGCGKMRPVFNALPHPNPLPKERAFPWHILRYSSIRPPNPAA